jgi:ferrous iron transport protein B
MNAAQAVAIDPMRLALVGVPNSGKTALFNRLTGSRQRVANYAGVTVERKEGQFVGPARQRLYKVLDLPGAYSLTPTTLDEAITRDFLLGRLADEPPPEFVVCVVDATNLRLNLRLVLELRELGVPMVVALNMSDLAETRGYHLDRGLLEQQLGVPVVETVAVDHHGVRHLRGASRVSTRSSRPSARYVASSRRSATSSRCASVRSRSWTRWCCIRSPAR